MKQYIIEFCFDFSEKNIIIIYEIKRNVGGNYAKRYKKGEQSYNSYN